MKNLILSAVLAVVISFTSFAQFGSSGSVDARSMSMAKTYNASSSGVYSIGFNPANMMFGSHDIEFTTVLPLPQLAFSGGTSFISIKDINYFFGGDNGKARYLNAEDKTRLNELFDGGGEVFTGISANLFSIMYKHDPVIGAFAFSINDFFGARLNVPAAIVDLGLNGNQFNKVYNFNDADMESYYIRNYALSYSRELSEIEQDIFDKIAVGISLKLVSGYYYVGLEKIHTSLETSSSQNNISASAHVVTRGAISKDFGVEFDFDSTGTFNKNIGPFPTPAGSGFGFDIGFGAIMGRWRFSAAVTDIGSINWDNNTFEYVSSGDMVITDLSDQKQRDSLSEKFKSKGQYIGGFTTSLPTTLRLGAAYMFTGDEDYIPGDLLLALDINQGFNEEPGNSKKMRVSLGTEWMPMGWMNVRTGFSFGGIDGFNWALGLGLDAGLVEFNFATSDMHSFASPNTAKRISFSFGSRWKI